MFQELLMGNVGTILALTAVTLYLWFYNGRPKNAPPGPWFYVPVIGNLVQIGRNPVTSFREMRKKYGDVFSVYMANRLVVVINGFDTMKEAFVKNSDLFSDRPRLYFTKVITFGKGVVGSSGDVWNEQRKFALFTLKNLGMGKDILQLKIQDEASALNEELAKREGKATDVRNLIGSAVCNIIVSIVFGKRFEYNDPKYVNFLEIMEENVLMPPILHFFPFLRHLPGDMFKIKHMTSGMQTVQRDLVQASINEHKENYDEDNTDDFISAYIKEMKKKQKLGESTSMDNSNLCAVIQDLFLGGTETSSTTLQWLLLYFLHFPEVQKKCFEEIQRNVGCDRMICLEDKTKLPYMEATIMEILRHADVAPLSLMRIVPRDIEFKGYTIPNDTLIIPNIDSVLSDLKIWGDPEVFQPERFLDENGRLTKPEEWIPFLFGARNCMGESLARMELFLFLSSMLQKFEFVKGEEGFPTLECQLGFTQKTQPYTIKAILRT